MDNATVALLLYARNTHEQIAILLQRGMTQVDIIRILHVSSKTITKIKSALDKGQPIPDMGKRGQPTKKTTEVITITIEETINNPRLSGSALQIIIAAQTGITISVPKILEIRKEAGFYFSPPKVMPILNELNIKKRINFCYSILKHREIIPFIGFTDESRFCMGNDRRWVWIRRGEFNEKAYVEKEKYPISIMVWGMIAFAYKSKLLFVENTLDACRYIDLLKDNGVLEDAIETFGDQFKFQQDGAPVHTAKKAMRYLTQRCDVIVNWPPNSPDLNVIEMIWAIMKAVLAEERPKTADEFKIKVSEVWNQISIDTTIKNLVNSFTMRCYLCLENEGKCINHLIKHNMGVPTDEQIQELFAKCEEKGMQLTEIPLFRPKNT